MIYWKKNMLLLICQIFIYLTLPFTFLLVNIYADNPIQNSYLFEYNGHYKKALDLMLPLAQRQPHNYLAHLRVAYLSYMTGKLDQSIFYYKKSIALYSKAIEPRLGLLLPLMAKGNYQQVVFVAQAVLRMDAKNYTARQKLAYSLYMSGRYRQAAQYYKSIVDDYPSDGLMHLGLGWSQYKQKGCSSAKKSFARALTILPANKKARAAAILCP